MNGRERIETSCNHQSTDKLPVDFGASMLTGFAVNIVYQLRQRLGLDKPGTPVKVLEPYQMLGVVEPDLQEVLDLDAVALTGTDTMFGFKQENWKEWKLHDGTPVLVPEKYNTVLDSNGNLPQYPEGDKTLKPSAKMIDKGYFFDAITRQDHYDEDKLNYKDNCEEFTLMSDAELLHFKTETDRLYKETDKALFCTFPGAAFGDIALVPGTFLRDPKGIRDVSEWYMTTVTEIDYIKSVFDFQAEIALENLKKLYKEVGNKISVICLSGTDFGTQNGTFLSSAQYCDLYKPYQKRLNDWVHANTEWKTFMHSCGAVEPLVNDFINAGWDILNPVQCSCPGMEPKEIKKKFGDRITFWGGGIDTQKTLPFGTPEQVKEEAKQRIEIFSKNGGFVFNGIHNLVATVPIDNILAMFDVIKQYR